MTVKKTEPAGDAAAADGETITVYVNGKPVDLPGAAGGLWPMSEIAHHAYAAGVTPLEGTGAGDEHACREPELNCPCPPCRCPPYVRARLKGGEEFDFTHPKYAPPTVSAS